MTEHLLVSQKAYLMAINLSLVDEIRMVKNLGFLLEYCLEKEREPAIRLELLMVDVKALMSWDNPWELLMDKAIQMEFVCPSGHLMAKGTEPVIQLVLASRLVGSRRLVLASAPRESAGVRKRQ